jgi:hypothetical protein
MVEINDPVRTEFVNLGQTFTIGSNDLIRVTEKKTASILEYQVVFSSNTPTCESVDASIELLKVFSQIKWDFTLVCDLRCASLNSQLRYATSYARLIKIIHNENCKHCFVHIPKINAFAEAILVGTISRIVAALQVDFTILSSPHTQVRIQPSKNTLTDIHVKSPQEPPDDIHT